MLIDTDPRSVEHTNFQLTRIKIAVPDKEVIPASRNLIFINENGESSTYLIQIIVEDDDTSLPWGHSRSQVFSISRKRSRSRSPPSSPAFNPIVSFQPVHLHTRDVPESSSRPTPFPSRIIADSQPPSGQPPPELLLLPSPQTNSSTMPLPHSTPLPLPTPQNPASSEPPSQPILAPSSQLIPALPSQPISPPLSQPIPAPTPPPAPEPEPPANVEIQEAVPAQPEVQQGNPVPAADLEVAPNPPPEEPMAPRIGGRSHPTISDEARHSLRLKAKEGAPKKRGGRSGASSGNVIISSFPYPNLSDLELIELYNISGFNLGDNLEEKLGIVQ